MRINGEDVKPLVSVSCEAETKKKKPCPNNAHSMANGKWLCHLHNPEMLYRKQVAAKREDRTTERQQRSANVNTRQHRSTAQSLTSIDRNAGETARNVTNVTRRDATATHRDAPRRLNGLSLKPAHGPSITIPERRTDELDAPPSDGRTYYGLDKPLRLPLSAGKADPIPTSRRRD